MDKKAISLLILVALIAGAVAGGVTAFIVTRGDDGEQNDKTGTTGTGTGTSTVDSRTTGDTGVACTQDARLCPDGSYVGRVPPDCEFAQCPPLPPVQQAENIRVDAPVPGAVIGSPVTITGEARVFEGTVNYRVRDNTGRIIGEGSTIAASPEVGQFGPYSVAVSFDPPETAIGNIEVFNLSARDGSVENLVTIPVMFAP